MLLALLMALTVPTSTVVSVKDPADGKIRDYRGIPLQALLPRGATGDAALVRCSDGFVVLLPLEVLERYAPIVATEVLGERGWMAIPSPQGPRYLIWPNRTHPEIDQDEAVTSEGWAWGFDSVELVRGAKYLAPLTPPSAEKDLQRGRTLWMQSCFHCHAVHGAGGLVGWDLSEPTPLWKYRSEAEVVRVLHDPRSVNPTGQMPAQQLSPDQLRDLFTFMHAVLK